MNTSSTRARDGATSLIDAAAHSADHAIRESQRVANQTLDHLADQVESARGRADSDVRSLASGAAHLAERGTDALRRQSEQWREQAQHARGYIQHQPLKSLLIVAAAGAVLVLLGSLLTRRRH
jgi:ElaB/YqjD/DUF883 family membrane-anchored ribosome-binding protein